MFDFFQQSDVLQVMQGLNPWWSERLFEVPIFHRVAFFACRRFLDNARLRQAALLSGPRRVGKTIVLQQLVTSLIQDGRDPKSICYLSLDHPLLRLVSLPDLLRLYHAAIFPPGRPVILLLDEIEYTDDWARAIKQLMDAHPECQILAAGAVNVQRLAPAVQGSLGHWLMIPIPPLSFFEFIYLRNDDPPHISVDLRPSHLFSWSPQELAVLASECHSLLPLFRRYLLIGGFPETATQADVMNGQRLLRDVVFDRVLRHDLATLDEMANLHELSRLFIYVCLRNGRVIDVVKCAEALQLPPAVVDDHLAILEQQNLIHIVSPTGPRSRVSQQTQCKVYLSDASLGHVMLQLGDRLLHQPEAMDSSAETMVLRHLYTYYFWNAPEYAYWRDDVTNKSVDLIVKTTQTVLPIDVSYLPGTRLGVTDALVVYCQMHSIDRAYYVTLREEDFGVLRFRGLPTKILQIPAHIFTYLLGQAERRLWQG